MRQLNYHHPHPNLVEVTDDAGQGGACHSYRISDPDTGIMFSSVKFQNGPIDEVGGVNGIFHEDLLAIEIHHYLRAIRLAWSALDGTRNLRNGTLK
jgi:hypothetical protein